MLNDPLIEVEKTVKVVEYAYNLLKGLFKHWNHVLEKENLNLLWWIGKAFECDIKIRKINRNK